MNNYLLSLLIVCWIFWLINLGIPLQINALNQLHELFGLPHYEELVITPIFTESAYRNDCWYLTNNTTCEIHEADTGKSRYSGSYFGSLYMCLMYECKTDLEIHENPSILYNYTRIILLHNEYVTEPEYNAIMNHDNVFYAYPNALYKFVTIEDNYMTLGNYTGNPQSLSKWGNVDEFTQCFIDYEIVEYSNGKGLTCYPHIAMLYDSYLKLFVMGS